MVLYRFNIHCQLTAQTVLDRIRSLAREGPGFKQSFKERFGWRPDNSPPFIGEVEGNEFNLCRDIQYRNSFLPQIHGRINPETNGADVSIAMSLHPVVAIFLVLWLCCCSAGGLSVVLHRPSQALIPLGMIAAALVMTSLGFYLEAIRARRILENALGSVSA